jgi:hypothetical protein
MRNIHMENLNDEVNSESNNKHTSSMRNQNQNESDSIENRQQKLRHKNKQFLKNNVRMLHNEDNSNIESLVENLDNYDIESPEQISLISTQTHLAPLKLKYLDSKSKSTDYNPPSSGSSSSFSSVTSDNNSFKSTKSSNTLITKNQLDNLNEINEGQIMAHSNLKSNANPIRHTAKLEKSSFHDCRQSTPSKCELCSKLICDKCCIQATLEFYNNQNKLCLLCKQCSLLRDRAKSEVYADEFEKSKEIKNQAHNLLIDSRASSIVAKAKPMMSIDSINCMNKKSIRLQAELSQSDKVDESELANDYNKSSLPKYYNNNKEHTNSNRTDNSINYLSTNDINNTNDINQDSNSNKAQNNQQDLLQVI